MTKDKKGSKLLFMKKIIYFLLFICSTTAFSDSTPKGWMPTTLVKGPDWRLFQIYSKSLPLNQVQQACQQVQLATKKEGQTIFEGCAQISYALGTCHYIYEANNENAHEHERRHCAGLDHLNPKYVSEISMQDTWNFYQEQLKNAKEQLIKQGWSKEKAAQKVVEMSESQAITVLQKNNLPITPTEAKTTGWTFEYNHKEWYRQK